MKTFHFALLFIGLACTTYAQNFEISTELRPRLEYRHGYNTLLSDSLNAATFVSQRSRLNLMYNSHNLKVFLSIQNVRVWGDISTLSLTDKNGTALHQAWAEIKLSSNFKLKFGRQELIYDDHRIFGNVGWAQQARSHDALIAQFEPTDRHRFDLGFAINENSESLVEIDYLVNNYKAFQYLWYHTNIKQTGISILILNNGLTFVDENEEQQVQYNQTIGSRFTIKKNKITADASIYIQSGKIENRKLSAYNVSGNFHHNLNDKFKVGLGAEYLSGTDMNSSDNKLKSFTPWFGTNHKFNGLMDYFYVGNHNNSVGLFDINATIQYHKRKFSAKMMPHLFYSAATVVNEIGNPMKNALGTELDLVMVYKWTNDINFQLGYSQLFATETMKTVKGVEAKTTNNWAWFMITVNPSLFKSTPKNN